MIAPSGSHDYVMRVGWSAHLDGLHEPKRPHRSRRTALKQSSAVAQRELNIPSNTAHNNEHYGNLRLHAAEGPCAGVDGAIPAREIGFAPGTTWNQPANDRGPRRMHNERSAALKMADLVPQ